MAFSIGSFIGPIIAGQILAHKTVGTSWTILTIISSALSALCLPGILIWGRSKLFSKTAEADDAAEEPRGVDREETMVASTD